VWARAVEVDDDFRITSHVLNLGTGHKMAERLNGLKLWVREQEAASPA
jgi:hypothetical protein